MQDGRNAVWSIPYVSVAFFPSLKQNFIAYRFSKVSDCIFKIHQLWQSGFSRVYSNCCCSCSFEPEIIKIGQSSHKMYSNSILNLQGSTTILNAHTKKVRRLIVCTSYHLIVRSNFNLLNNSEWITFPTQTSQVFYFVCTGFQHPLSMWLIDLYQSPHYSDLLFCRLHFNACQYHEFFWCSLTIRPNLPSLLKII